MSYYVCRSCNENKSGEELINQLSIINIVKNKCIFCNKKQSFHSKLNKKMSKIYKKCKNLIYNNGCCNENKSGEELINQLSIINIVKNKCIFCNKKQSFHSKLNKKMSKIYKKMSKIYKKCKNLIYNNEIIIMSGGYVIIAVGLYLLTGLISIYFLPCFIIFMLFPLLMYIFIENKRYCTR
jgi:predicted transcriptional regulator